MLKVIDTFYNVIRSVIRVIVAVAFFMMFAMCVSQVFCRSVLQIPFVFGDETCRLAFFFVMFYSGSLCILDGAHLKVDVLYSNYGPKLKRVMDLVIGICIIYFCFYLTKSGYAYAQSNRNAVTSALAVPYYFLYMNIPVTGALMILAELKIILDKVILNNDSKKGGSE